MVSLSLSVTSVAYLSVTYIIMVLHCVAPIQNGDIFLLCACRDGVSQSGLFVTVSCIWERLKDEHEVDVFQTVKQLRFHRPELIINLVGIRCCCVLNCGCYIVV